jgi:hypothetical protein
MSTISQLNSKLLKKEVQIAQYNSQLLKGLIDPQKHYDLTNQLNKDIHSIQLKIAELDDDVVFTSRLSH